MSDPQQTSEQFDLLGVLRQRAGLIVACALAVAGLAYVLSSSREARYESTALLRVISDSGPLLPGRQVQPEPTGGETGSTPMLATRQVTVRAARRAGVPLDRARVSAKQLEDSDIIRVTAGAPQPQLAANLANAFAAELRAERRAPGPSLQLLSIDIRALL